MATPAVTVVVPTFNEEKYISPCIEALKHQTFKDFEVVALDKSTDSTPKICRSAGWRVITQKQPGVSAARKEGFAAARGQIIASTDADSAPSPQWLENIVTSFVDPQVVCVYGPTYFMDQTLGFRMMSHLNTLYLLINRALKNDQTVGMNFAVRKTAYEKIGGYNTSLPTAEDVDIGYRIRKVGKIIYHPQVIVYTSSRRLRKEGWRFFAHHFANFFRLKFTGKSSSNFIPIRDI